MSMLTRLAATSSQPITFVDDVFSTWLYTGSGSTQTITNGINLSVKGGMVWIKQRGDITSSALFDTVRGAAVRLSSDTTSGNSGGAITFNSDGFGLDTTDGNITNGSGKIYSSWTFREASKFFDVVTYTGTGANRAIAHNLQQVPGCILIKRTDTTADWQVYHVGIANTEYLILNSAANSATGTTRWNSTTATATEFSIGTDTTVNANAGTYVAYLFAHDTSADGLIQCGTYTGNGSATGPTVSLGWEPQWLMIKRATGGTGSWNIFDNMRGMTVGGNDWYLQANATTAETGADWLTPTSSGFQITSTSTEVNNNTNVYIYVAIRRSNKPPSAGTQVFQPTIYTGTKVDNQLVSTTVAPDMVWVRQRNDTVLGGMVVGDRLRGQPYLLTGSTAVEASAADAFDQQIISTTEYGTAFSSMAGFWVGNDVTAKLNANATASNHIALAFKRARKFFDVVCYTGDGTDPRNIPHSLGAVPELIIFKGRTDNDATTGQWHVYFGTTQNLILNSNIAAESTGVWGGYTPTSSNIVLQNSARTNALNVTYVAYLFATVAGVSKVGTYTGNGTSQTINCGFTTGARFVLIKRTDSTGDWYVFDSARGIGAGNDPRIALNLTSAEVTTEGGVSSDTSGFVVTSDNPPGVNINAATYLYLAIA